jgi:hypothetical protein
MRLAPFIALRQAGEERGHQLAVAQFRGLAFTLMEALRKLPGAGCGLRERFDLRRRAGRLLGSRLEGRLFHWDLRGEGGLISDPLRPYCLDGT